MPNETTVPTPDLARWLPLTDRSTADNLKLNLPIEHLFGEATDLARFVDQYWETKRDGSSVVTPGLNMANRTRGKLRFDAGSATELLSLIATTQAAQTAYQLTLGPAGSSDAREAARADLSELQGAIEVVLDDGIEDERDRQLAHLDDTHKDGGGDDGLSAALADYAGLARQGDIYPELEELAAQGGFDIDVVARCEQHVNTLRMLPAAPRPKDPAALKAFEQRNLLGNLLQQRIRLVRAAARWVFRKQPKIAKQATSAYERRKRAEARRRLLPQTPDQP